MTQKTRTTLSWIMTVCLATSVVCAIMGMSQTSSHRLWVAGTMGFMLLYSGWVWSTNHYGIMEHADIRPDALRKEREAPDDCELAQQPQCGGHITVPVRDGVGICPQPIGTVQLRR